MPSRGTRLKRPFQHLASSMKKRVRLAGGRSAYLVQLRHLLDFLVDRVERVFRLVHLDGHLFHSGTISIRTSATHIRATCMQTHLFARSLSAFWTLASKRSTCATSRGFSNRSLQYSVALAVHSYDGQRLHSGSSASMDQPGTPPRSSPPFLSPLEPCAPLP